MLWLGDTLDVVVDQATRRAPVLGGSTAAFTVDECQTYPGAALGNGSDVAFCRVHGTAIDERRLVRPAMGCERTVAVPGATTVLVGFGADETGHLGTKRVVNASIQNVSAELAIGTATDGACAGDSGGPAFIRVPESTGNSMEWSMLGILSSGTSGTECSVGNYVDLSSLMSWLETETGRDLTPCSDASGKWSPSENCRTSALDENGVPLDSSSPAIYSAACGAAFVVPAGDEGTGCAVARAPSGAPCDTGEGIVSGGVLVALGRRAKKRSRVALHRDAAADPCEA